MTPFHTTNMRHFCSFSSLHSALFFWTCFPVRKKSFNIIFAPPLGVSYSHLTNLGKLIFNRFWGVLFQPVHLKWHKSHFRSFSLFDSALCFFLKTSFRVRKDDFKIIFAPPLGFLAVIWPNLVNLYLTDFGACSANQWIQNQI